MDTSVLFEEIKIGNLRLKNRFVMPAMNSHHTTNNKINDNGLAYYREHAKGHFGLCITEFTAVSPDGMGSLKELGIWSDDFISSLKQLSDAVHEDGGRIFLQLHHAGIASKSSRTDFKPKAPSAMCNEQGEMIEEYTEAEIREITECFIKGAVRAKAAGFDGVEIHGAHGYLINNFLSRKLNRRIDNYGGSYEKRFRIAEEIIAGIKKTCGEDFPISFRMNALDGNDPDDNKLEDMCIYARMAEKAGADCIHVSNANIIATYFCSPGFNSENARAVKKSVSVPVIVVGRINDEHVAENIIASGAADMVALGRQSICDPHFPLKLEKGKQELIFHCLACFQRCSPDVGCEEDDIGVSCMINPFTGKELRWKLEPAERSKKIAIIGAGCAGLQAAWILAARGHQVTVYEKSNRIGGNLIAAAAPPMKYGFLQLIDTLKAHCTEYGVAFSMNSAITKNNIGKLDADEIIVASGSTPWKPDIPGLPSYLTAEDVLLNKVALNNKKTAVIGGGSVGIETAEYLLSSGNQVEVFEMKDKIATDMPEPIRADILRRLNGYVKFHTGASLIRYDEGALEFSYKEYKERTERFDEIVIAMGYRSLNMLTEEVIGRRVTVIGDAKKAGTVKMAIYEATKLGLEI